MTLPAYEKLSDSGVLWLGPVPDAWRVVPLKHVAEFVNGCVFKPDSWSETGIPIIRIENLNGSSSFNFYNGEIDRRHHVSNGDLLFGWSGNRGTSFGPFVWKGAGLHYLNQHIFKVQAIDSLPRWLYWSLRAVTAHVEDQATGIIGMVHVTKGDLGAIKVPVPEAAEQAAIATFLDRETAKIDALIAEQEKLIALLAEKRQATISHAVTRGLNPNAPMKGSGVPWLGDVPAHWALVPAKRVASIFVPQRNKPELNDVGDGVRWATMEDMKQPRLRSTGLFVSKDAIAAAGSRVLGPGAVIASCVGNFGVATINEVDVVINQQLQAFVPGPSVLAEFLAVVVLASSTYFELVGTAATLVYVNQEGFENLPVPLPPLTEQKAILAKLDGDLFNIGELGAQSQRAIDLLKERRSALIAAAVTGQIDVRSLVPA